MKFIEVEKLLTGVKHLQGKFPFITYETLFHLITSIEQEQPEGVQGTVQHYRDVHYINTNAKQLDARLKQIPEGTEIEMLIFERKGE